MKGFLSEERPIRTLREVLQRLRESYCGKIGYEVRRRTALLLRVVSAICLCVWNTREAERELCALQYMHIPDRERCNWLRERIETPEEVSKMCAYEVATAAPPTYFMRYVPKSSCAVWMPLTIHLVCILALPLLQFCAVSHYADA